MTVDNLCAAVTTLLQEAGVEEPPVPIERMARLRGAQLRYAPHEGDLSGALVKDGEQVVIAVNACLNKLRQRFTIAHELAQLWLHGAEVPHIDHLFAIWHADGVGAQPRDIAEAHTNSLALELLIPSKLLAEDLQDVVIDYLDETPVRRLANRYGVNAQLMTFRLAQIALSE